MRGLVSQSTIYALSSAQGRAGVAVIRVTGEKVLDALYGLCKSPPLPRYAGLRTLKHPKTQEILDKALVIWFPGPHSFSGEDLLELHVHGGHAVLQGVLEALGSFEGFRFAEPGEFSRRAFENGKLDLTEVEGLADLINAETEAQKRQALQQSSGNLRQLYDGWRQDILLGLASMEAALDFSDEADVPDSIASEALPYVQRVVSGIQDHLNDGHRGEILRDGFRVVIAGPPNAGKSSLLNLFAQRDVAIVSEEAGTTRDVLEVRLNLEGFPVILSDTAGIRQTSSKVEQEGIRRSHAQASLANLILWMQDAKEKHGESKVKNYDEPPHFFFHPPQNGDDKFDPPEAQIWTVLNKIDCLDKTQIDEVSGDNLFKISVKTGDGIDELIQHISDLVKNCVGSQDMPIISRVRYRQELENCLEALNRFYDASQLGLELQAEELRSAAHAIGRITGRIDVEDVLDEIFGSFCIGK